MSDQKYLTMIGQIEAASKEIIKSLDLDKKQTSEVMDSANVLKKGLREVAIDKKQNRG